MDRFICCLHVLSYLNATTTRGSLAVQPLSSAGGPKLLEQLQYGERSALGQHYKTIKMKNQQGEYTNERKAISLQSGSEEADSERITKSAPGDLER